MICQLIENSAARMSTICTTLLTRPDRIEVKAVWAPMTSLLSRLTRAPVCARVKKAIGWRRTCAKTSVRRSRMSPSPIREPSQRVTTVTTDSTTASTATTSPSRTTTSLACGTTPSSMIRCSSSGTAVTSAPATTVSTRYAAMSRTNGRP